MNNLKVIFMGTPEFSLNVLNMLIENTNVIGVVTQPDKIVGKNKEKSFDCLYRRYVPRSKSCRSFYHP